MKATEIEVFKIEEMAKKLGIIQNYPFDGEVGPKYVVRGRCFPIDCFVDADFSFSEKKENVYMKRNGRFYAICE